MKLFNAIASAAVIGASFLVPNPVEARNGWMQGGCDAEGKCVYQKVISTNWPYVTFKENRPGGTTTKVADCQQWRSKFISVNGELASGRWSDAMPGSIGEKALNNVCR